MARSGSRDFSLNRNNLIKRAFQLASVYNLHDTVASDDNSFASDLLNAMIKEWQTDGMKLWNRKEATVFTAYQTAKYAAGLTGGNITETYVSTTLSAAEASGQTVLSITDTTGMTAADNVGIKLSDNTRQWTTISSVDSGTQITVADALTASAASGATVVSYTSKIDRPLDIHSARSKNLTETSEIVLEKLGHEDYFDIADKTTDGLSTCFYYDKQLDNGQLYLWPRPDDVDYVINITYYESVEDMDNATDDFDFPSEWTRALLWNLASEIAYAYGMNERIQLLVPKAQQSLLTLQEHNLDNVNLRLSPQLRRDC